MVRQRETQVFVTIHENFSGAITRQGKLSARVLSNPNMCYRSRHFQTYQLGSSGTELSHGALDPSKHKMVFPGQRATAN